MRRIWKSYVLGAAKKVLHFDCVRHLTEKLPAENDGMLHEEPVTDEGEDEPHDG